MSGGTTAGRAPHGLQRLLLRAPVVLYRIGLGWLLGERFLLLSHIGRKSGRPYQTVLEVVAHERDVGAYVVASGWGERSDWFQNILQHPSVKIAVGGRRLAAEARRMPEGEAAAALADYARRHPVAFRGLARMMLGEELALDAEGIARLAARVPLVSLHYRAAEEA